MVSRAINGSRAPTRSSRPPDQRDISPMISVNSRNTAPASVAEYPCLGGGERQEEEGAAKRAVEQQRQQVAAEGG